MSNPILSICIPTYNRAAELSRLIRENLAKTKAADFEIVVSDNCSTDDTLRLLDEIHDTRLRVFRNSENVGSWENSAQVLTCGSGKYSMILMDKDLIDLGRIEDILDVLSKIDVAAGRLVLDVEMSQAGISWRIRKGILDILRHEGLKFAHPSGYFFKTETLKKASIFERLRSADPVLRPYSTDFQVLLMAMQGSFATIKAPLVYLQLPPFKGLARSFTYREDEDLFFMPQYLHKVFAVYVKMLREQNVASLLRFMVIARKVRFLYGLSTKGYVSILNKDNICNWYGLSSSFRERQRRLPLQRAFLDRFLKHDNIGGIDGLVARVCALFAYVFHR